jgi:putative membrane protein
MIYYTGHRVISIICRWHGSPFNSPAPLRALFMAVVSLLLAVVVTIFNPTMFVYVNASTAIKDLLPISNSFLSLLISFRLSAAFSNWKIGLSDIVTLNQTARTLLSMMCSYMSMPADDLSNVSEKRRFLQEMRRLLLVYFSMIFHDSREEDALPALQHSGWVNNAEFSELVACGRIRDLTESEQYSSGTAAITRRQCGLVELWLRRLIQEMAAQKGIIETGHAATLHGQVSVLLQIHTRMFSTAHIPIPFNYAQYVQVCIYLYLVLYMVVIVPDSKLFTPIWVFIWGTVLLTAEHVASEIECPFGTDPNDIDSEERLIQLEDELTTLVQSQLHRWGCLDEFVTKNATSPQKFTNETSLLLKSRSGKQTYKSLSSDINNKD